VATEGEDCEYPWWPRESLDWTTNPASREVALDQGDKEEYLVSSKMLLLRFWVRLKERRQEVLTLIESRMAPQDRLLRLAVDTGEEGGSRASRSARAVKEFVGKVLCVLESKENIGGGKI